MIWWCFLVLLVHALPLLATSSVEECFCGYRRSGLLLMLRCVSQASSLQKNIFHPITCHRINGLTRLGDSNEVNSSNLAIEPYGLSELADPSTTALQINLPIKAKLMDALSFAGLWELKVFQALRNPVALDACSLAGLPKLENIILNCTSSFDRFLTFGPTFKSIRLVGCLDLPIQFVCTKCSQRPEVNVLRILPGPPSMVNRVTFESHVANVSPSSIVMGQCLPGICSDDHLCRNDYALSLAKEFNHKNIINNQTPHTTTPKPTTQVETLVGQIASIPHNSQKYILLSVIIPIMVLVFLLAGAICVSLLVKMVGCRSHNPQTFTLNGVSEQVTTVTYNPIVDKS